MKKYWILSPGALAATGIIPAVVAAPQQQKPNVVIIMTDQQSFNMMSCEGNRFLSTPNMDRLAAEGYRFERTYVANPVSQPSRYALFTGRFSSDVGIKKNSKNPAETATTHNYNVEFGMGHLFTRAGYDAVFAGKTHFYQGSGSLGFKRITSDPYDGTARKAEEFFASRVDNDKPYIAVFSFLNPHDICLKAGIGDRYNDIDPYLEGLKDATEHYLDIKTRLDQAEYRKQIPPMRPNMARVEKQISQVTDLSIGVQDFTRDDWELYNWMYHRLTESVDAQIGRVLTAMDKAGAWENTIVVFTSDHGEMQGSHGILFKNVPFEECQRVPFIFVGKGIKRNFKDSNTLVCNGTDLMPTLCDLTGVTPPSPWVGISLKPFLIGQGTLPKRDYIITETYQSFQITDGRYKYTVFEVPGNPDMLIDLGVDPLELRNFIHDPKYAKIKADMRDKLMKNLNSRGLLPLTTNKGVDMKKQAVRLQKEREQQKQK